MPWPEKWSTSGCFCFFLLLLNRPVRLQKRKSIKLHLSRHRFFSDDRLAKNKGADEMTSSFSFLFSSVCRRDDKEEQTVGNQKRKGLAATGSTINRDERRRGFRRNKIIGCARHIQGQNESGNGTCQNTGGGQKGGKKRRNVHTQRLERKRFSFRPLRMARRAAIYIWRVKKGASLSLFSIDLCIAILPPRTIDFPYENDGKVISKILL